MSREEPPTIDADTQLLAGRMADTLIVGYWNDFVFGHTWNYHGWPPKYVPGDRWASRDQWIAVARRCIEENTHLLSAYEVLLTEGLTECAADALALAQDWHDSSGHDPEYYYGVLARLPDCALRRFYLNNEDTDEIFEDGATRRALISVEDARTCELVAGRIVHDLSPVTLDAGLVRGAVIPRLAEMGPLCRKYVPEAAMARAKQFCLEGLATDRASGSWPRGKIAYTAWRVGWHDVLRELEGDAWYWSSTFELDSDNCSLLTWSLLVSNDALKARALEVMRTDPSHRIDGAIAWVRLHAVPLQGLRPPPHSG